MRGCNLLKHLALKWKAIGVGDLSHDLLRSSCGRNQQGGTCVNGSLAWRAYATALAVHSHLVKSNLPVRLGRDWNGNEVTCVLRAVAATKRQLGVVLGAGGDTAEIDAELVRVNGTVGNEILEEGSAVVLRNGGKGHADDANGVERGKSNSGRSGKESLVGRGETSDGNIVNPVVALG